MKNKWPALVHFPYCGIYFTGMPHCVRGVLLLYAFFVCVSFFSILVYVCDCICSYIFNCPLISKYVNT